MAPSNVENFSPNVIKQISRELCDLTQNPLEGVRVVFNEDDITSVQADIDGPPGTPYYGGSFRVRLVLGKNFPISPPKGFFVTKIFHPNVGRNGEICVNTLKKDWNQDLGIKHILLTIKCLLIVPNPESALNEEAGKMLLEQYDDYCKRAKMMTEIHAPRAKTSVESCVDSQNGSTIDCGGQQSSASSSSVAGVIINGNNAGIHSNSNNNTDPSTATTTNTTTTAPSTTAATTLYDKTASSSTSANTYGAGANSGGGSVGAGGIKHPLDEVCCSEEPVTKRLNSILDCYNPTADQQNTQQANNHVSALQQPIVQQNKKGPPTAGAKAAGGSSAGTSNKNRGLKRVLRLRS